MENICRTCTSACDTSKISIFQARNLADLNLVLRGHLAEASPADALPEWLCVDCQGKLIVAASYIRQATMSHEALVNLQNLVKIKVEKESDDDDDESNEVTMEENTVPDIKIKEEKEDVDFEAALTDFKLVRVPIMATPPLVENVQEMIHIKLEEQGDECERTEPETTLKLIRVPVAPIDSTSVDTSRMTVDELLNMAKTKNHKVPTPKDQTLGADFVCGECGKTFKKRNALSTHLRVHKSHLQYQCNVCDRKFKTSGPLRAHMTRHAGDTQTCELCGKAFNTDSYIYHLQREHEVDKPYACQKCPRSFKQKNALYRHVKIVHAGVKYACSICGKTYATNDSLKCHLHTHAEKLPHPCPLCERSFPVRGRLNLHMKMVHAGGRDSLDAAREEVAEPTSDDTNEELLSVIKIEEPDMEV